ncbi:PAS domain S-box protein, partial [Candidatus Aerophobetes bacterium]|nr:PAS domain S-box protein [Candidatus Aerophobetes bacterium]
MENKDKKKEKINLANELAKSKQKIAELEKKEIEQEKMLQKSEERYRAIFETTGTAMIIVEENMVISKVNKEFERLSGYQREEIEGKKSWTEFVV